MPFPDRLPYVPRPALLGEILERFSFDENVALYARQRKGKTHFLQHELLPAAHRAGCFAARVNIRRRDYEAIFDVIAALESIAYATPTGQPLPARKITRLPAQDHFQAPVADIEGDWCPADHDYTGRPLDNGARLKNALEFIAGRSDHAMLAIDECMGLATPEAESFVMLFREVLRDFKGRISVVFTSASRPAIDKLFHTAKKPWLGFAEVITLPNMGDEFVESRADYVERISVMPVDREALMHVFPRLRHTPQFLDELVRGMLVSGDTNVASAFDNWLEAKRLDEYGDLISEMRASDFPVALWMARSGEKSVYTAEAREAIGTLMGRPYAFMPFHANDSIRRLRKSGVVQIIDMAGLYELADEGLEIVLHELSTSPA